MDKPVCSDFFDAQDLCLDLHNLEKSKRHFYKTNCSINNESIVTFLDFYHLIGTSCTHSTVRRYTGQERHPSIIPVQYRRVAAVFLSQPSGAQVTPLQT